MPLRIVPIDILAAEKGFSIQLQSDLRGDAKQMLQEGRFSGIVRFQLAKRGDPVSDLVSYTTRAWELPCPSRWTRVGTRTGCRRCG